MTLFERLSPAKLNLYLHIVGKRDDGFHLLDSLVVFTQFGDQLTAKPANTVSLHIEGEFAAGLGAQDNLVMRAALALQSKYDVQQGAILTLEKRIPVGAGLGGGSANAATALLLLNALWEIDAPMQELETLAITLGADVPACLYAQALHMGGIGEVITPMPDFSLTEQIVLVNPRLHVSTPDVFKQFARAPRYQQPIAEHERMHFTKHHNDLQDAAITICPAIADILALLQQQQGCDVARMCGSGATCFGLFAGKQEASAAVQTIKAVQPNWWVKSTALL